ncbi:MAG: hypothetical protein WBW94_05585 [Anaerolineales bacterium]
MKTKILAIVLAYSFLVSSCNAIASPTPAILSKSTLALPSSTTTPTSTPTLAPTMTATNIPIVTAVPINDPNNQAEIEKIIFDVLGKKRECSRPILNFPSERKEVGDPIFTARDSQYGSTALGIEGAIYENQSGTMQAVVACMPFYGAIANACWDTVIVKENTLNKVYDISFVTQAGNRPTYMYTWIGNDILVFSQNNEATETIVAVDVRTQKYVYLGIYFYYAPGCQ